MEKNILKKNKPKLKLKLKEKKITFVTKDPQKIWPAMQNNTSNIEELTKLTPLTIK